jgi:hypothetical protein
MANTYKRLGPLIANLPEGGGGDSTGYTKNFITDDWVPVAGNYRLNIPQSEHEQGISPVAQVFELIGSDYSKVLVSVEISSAGDVTLRISQLPDLRFSGKCIIT